MLHALESRPDDEKPSDRTRTILVSVAQFALGCLLSGFCVFYIRSASIGASWPFLLCMAGIFIGNEYLRHYHARLVFSALLFFFSLYSYAILLVPVVIARIGTRSVPDIGRDRGRGVLFLSCRPWPVWAMTAIAVARMQIAAGMIGDHRSDQRLLFREDLSAAAVGAVGCRHLSRDPNGSGRDYQVTAEDEPPRWRALFGTFPVEHIQPDDKLYLYSAIFAPYRLTTNIVHQWEWRDPKTGSWVPQQTVRFTIHGGREDGFRAYSSKTAPRPGQWRVNIATADGRAIGRVRFSVETQAVPPAVSVKTLK